MLQPYQSAALSIALFSLIKAQHTAPHADDLPPAWRSFTSFQKPRRPERVDTRLWNVVDDKWLESLVVNGLFGGEGAEPWEEGPARELKRLVAQIQKRAAAEAAERRRPQVPQ